jgi:hypothetical protein
MPMNFPDMKSLKLAAEVHKFREPMDNETEDDYRQALHDHVKPKDRVESFEILFKVGWNQWSETQKMQSLFS